MKILATLTLFLTLFLALSAPGPVVAQETNPADGAGSGHQMHMTPPAGHGALPVSPGQEAFGTVQEIVAILEANPATDWSTVDIDALRNHLIDMNEIALNAAAAVERLPGGIKVRITGAGRTLAAIQRLVPAQAAQLVQLGTWQTTAEPLPDGMLLTVLASDPAEVAKIQGLGFFGVISSGRHHQPHHLMIATGQHF